MILSPGQPIPHGRPHRCHPNGPIYMMTVRKRVGPLPTHRLAVRHSVDYSSSDHFSLDDSSSSSSSETSSDSSADALSDSTSSHSSSDHSLPLSSSGTRSSHRLCSLVPSVHRSPAAIPKRPSVVSEHSVINLTLLELGFCSGGGGGGSVDVVTVVFVNLDGKSADALKTEKSSLFIAKEKCTENVNFPLRLGTGRHRNVHKPFLHHLLPTYESSRFFIDERVLDELGGFSSSRSDLAACTSVVLPFPLTSTTGSFLVVNGASSRIATLLTCA
ncbi:hypothetical protein Tco_1046559 [Tanacetum coccineum]